MSRCIFCASFFLLACCAVLVAQEPPPADTPDVRQQALDHVRGLAGRIENLRDDAAKVRGLGQLGALVCKADPDYARGLLRKAHQIWRALPNSETPSKPSTPFIDPDDRRALRATLASQIAGCDPALALELSTADREAEESRPLTPPDVMTDLTAATAVWNEDAAKAAEFVKRALSAIESDRELTGIVSTLLRFQSVDSRVADELFLYVLADLRSQLRPTAYRVMMFGNYLFGPPMVSRPEGNGAIGGVQIAGANVPNLSTNRGALSPELVRAYLETSLNILSRPVDDPLQRQMDYAACYQLRRKAIEFAPDLVLVFEGLMQGLSAQVPEALRQDSTYSVLAAQTMPTSDSAVEELETTKDPRRREGLRLHAVGVLAGRGEFDRARTIAAEIEDAEVRAKLMELIDFSEAAKALETGKIEAARQLAAKLLPGIKRGLLYLGIGMALADAGETDAAVQSIFVAQRDAGALGAESQARLLIAIAACAASVQRDAALGALEQGVAAFNTLDRRFGKKPIPIITGSRLHPLLQKEPPGDEPDYTVNQWGFTQQVYLAQSSRGFRLQVKGASLFDFAPALFRLFAKDAERAESILAGLLDDSRHATALASLAAAYLERIPRDAKP